MIDFNVPPGAKVLELGGGGNRHPKATVNIDVRSEPGVDFTVDFDKPEWPEVSSDEFDIVYSCFCLEHISWRNTINFLKQTFRVLKPGGRALFVVPNTQAQMKYILNKPEFDGDEGSMIFGDLNYSENSHRAAFSPASITKQFLQAGFVNIITSPFGQLQTDMVVEAAKPSDKVVSPTTVALETPPPPTPPQSHEIKKAEPRKPAKDIFTRDYFNNYLGGGFVWDYPTNWLIAQKVLERQPQSVVELGCARGYVLKRIQDAGISGQGVDVSRHAWMTRVCEPIIVHDLCETPWPLGSKEFDLAYSVGLLDYIPEDRLPEFFDELTRISKRGLHGVTLEGLAANADPHRTTLRNLEYWHRVMPEGHEVVDVRDMSTGNIPPEVMNGDGKQRWNIGCAFTMFPGWTNIDTIDAENFGRVFNYKFLRHDVRNGIPTGTGVVDSIFMHHVCEHFTYDELARLLKECRRVIRPDGAMRIVVPDVRELTQMYHDLPGLKTLDEANEGCAKAPTFAGKLWAMLSHGHSCFLDEETLHQMLTEAGWVPHPASFRQTSVPAVYDILKGSIEMTYGDISCFVDATPQLG